MDKNKKTAKLLNSIGVVIMAIVIVLVIPLTVPKLFGLKLFNVLSESMEPLYKVGGVVYVREASVSDVEEGDVISYIAGSGTDIVVTHRVVAITDEAFITKGDANNTNDAEPVLFSRLVGKPVFYLPFFGALSEFIFSLRGLCVGIIVFGVTIGLWVYADMIFPKDEKAESKKREGKASQRKPVDVTKIGIALICIALLAGGIWGLSYFLANNAYTDIREEFAESVSASSESDAENLGTGIFGGNSTAGFLSEVTTDSLTLGFEALSEKYKNVVGWIWIPDTPINYPVLHGSDDKFYLRHSYDGKYSRVGSIFLTAANSSDFSDRYNLLYGHNMLDDSMFGPLLNYGSDASYIEDHPSFFIATKGGVNEYEIFAFFNVYPDDSMYLTSYYNEKDFDILVNNMAASSITDMGIKPDSSDDVVVLSTCSNHGKYRFVVCGRLKK